VNCDDQQLIDIPGPIPKYAIELSLRRNNLTLIDMSSFSQLKNLEILRLSENEISKIVPSTRFQIKLSVFEEHKHVSTDGLLTSNIGTFEPGITNKKPLPGYSGVNSVYLQSNRLQYIPPLCEFLDIQELWLDNNNIYDTIFPRCFTGNKKLTTLSLNNNSISTLSADTFTSLSGIDVSYLNIANNEIVEVSQHVFSPLNTVNYLDVSFNFLQLLQPENKTDTFNDGYYPADSRVESLHNFLRNLSLALSNKNLQGLYVSHNMVNVLPDFSFHGLKDLLTLDLSHCKLYKLHNSSFEGLDKLVTLHLQNNRIRMINSTFPNTLQTLYLFNNLISAIPREVFSNLCFLKVINLSRNIIGVLHRDSFKGLTSLTHLTMAFNNIRVLPGDIFQPLYQLRHLSLRKNYLCKQDLSMDLLSNLSSLSLLNLSHNNLIHLPSTLFDKLVSLKTLQLNQNRLGGVLKLAVKPLDSLENLDVKNNIMSKLNKHVFRSVPNLRFLDLSYNQLLGIDEETLQSIPNTLTRLALAGNTFACNCDLRYFRNWMSRTSVSLINNISYTCHSPESWIGASVLSYETSGLGCILVDLLVIIASFAVCLVVFATALYYKRWTLKLCIYKLKRRSRLNREHGHEELGDDEEQERPFDAYISSSPHDSTWIVKHLLPGIDNGELGDEDQLNGEFALYYDQRDALPGLF